MAIKGKTVPASKGPAGIPDPTADPIGEDLFPDLDLTLSPDGFEAGDFEAGDSAPSDDDVPPAIGDLFDDFPSDTGSGDAPSADGGSDASDGDTLGDGGSIAGGGTDAGADASDDVRSDSGGGFGADEGLGAASASASADGGDSDAGGPEETSVFRGSSETKDFVRPSPSHFVTDPEATVVNGKKGDETIEGSDGTDVVRGHKGDDDVSGLGRDDWLRGGHGDDTMDGGAGSDVVAGEFGDDTITYDFTENIGATDYYDGGKGSDTLVLKMTSEQFAEYQEELDLLRQWIEETADEKRSEGPGFSDRSAASARHPVFETSWGLTVRNFEDLRVEITDTAPPAEDPPAEDPPAEDPPAEDPPAEDPPADEPPITTDPGDGETVLIRETAVVGETVNVTLAPGSSLSLSITVDVTELPQIFDVFMMQDLTGSMWDDLPNVTAQIPDLYDALSADYDVAFGLGSFKDKPLTPFGEEGGTYTYTYGDYTYTYTYESDYTYQTELGMTKDKAALQEVLDTYQASGGYDWPESQLEALVQSALRVDEIGYRDGAQRFVVLQTDSSFHKAGDMAAYGYDVVANDYDVELTSRTADGLLLELEDYPDPAQVGALLKEAGITPIFVVSDFEASKYQALVDDWGVGTVTILSSDSANLSAAITEGLKAASNDLILDVQSDDYGFVTSVTPSIYYDVTTGSYTFDITLELPSDLESYTSDSLTFEITGYGEVTLDVEIARVDATGDDSANTIYGDAGANGLFGLGGNDILDGRGGEDLLDGGTGDDTLTGGLADDLFVFKDGDGKDIITDFKAGAGTEDKIDFSGVTFLSTFAAVEAAAMQVGADTEITYGDDSVILLGVSVEDLHQDDFIF